MTSVRQVHFDHGDTNTDPATTVTTHSRSSSRRIRRPKGMVYGFYVSPSALFKNRQKNNTTVPGDVYENNLDFKRTFCQLTHRRGMGMTFVAVARKSGYCVVLSKGASAEAEIQVLKELLGAEEEPRWYPIDFE